MKTAEEIFEEFYSEAFKNSPIALKLAFKEACIKVAIKYSNQKLDYAAEKVKTLTIDNGSKKNGSIGNWVDIVVDKKSLLDLKDKV